MTCTVGSMRQRSPDVRQRNRRIVAHPQQLHYLSLIVVERNSRLSIAAPAARRIKDGVFKIEITESFPSPTSTGGSAVRENSFVSQCGLRGSGGNNQLITGQFTDWLEIRMDICETLFVPTLQSKRRPTNVVVTIRQFGFLVVRLQ